MATAYASVPSPFSACPSSRNSCSACGHQSFASILNSRFPLRPIAASQVLNEATRDSVIDKSWLRIEEVFSEDELWATARLRVRSFNEFKPSTYGVQDLKRCLAEREFEALKERVAGKREGFKRVSCINATIPLSKIVTHSDDLSLECKFSKSGEARIVVATLDLNQCLWLPDEIAGKRPEGTEANFARAYLSNVCVARELQRNGLGYALVSKSKIIAQKWGITDLYVHVAIDNEPAKNLYMKSGFIHESDEPAWQARFLDRPRRILLWTGLNASCDL